MAEAFTQYKLMVLYLLHSVDFPLTNTQISNFVLGKEYTTYFTLQQTINELTKDQLIRRESSHNNTLYYITPEGQAMLSYFPDKISKEIKEDILSYLKENKLTLKQQVSVLADYYRTTNQNYVARCQIKDQEVPLIDLSIRTQTKEQAAAICENWKNQQEALYEHLMDLLLK